MEQSLQLNLLTLFFLVGYILMPPTAQAQDTTHLWLETSSEDLSVGHEKVIEVWVDESPPVYGVELHLSFDPNQLEVVDLQHGDFFSPDPDGQAFVIQNQADNQAGTIDYAMSLLNPAPEVSGRGRILQITVRAKADGPSTIQFADVLFGNQAGEQVNAKSEALIFQIEARGATVPTDTSDGAAPLPQDQTVERDSGASNRTWLGLSLVFGMVLIAGLGLVIVLGGVGVWWLIGRRNR